MPELPDPNRGLELHMTPQDWLVLEDIFQEADDEALQQLETLPAYLAELRKELDELPRPRRGIKKRGPKSES